jgi:hypothetical protein
MTRKRCYQAALGAILLAGSWLVGGVQAESGSKERERKTKVELMVVEKKQSEKAPRSNDTRRQRPPDGRH